MTFGATENGDLCAVGVGQNYFKPPSYAHTVQRGWSNKAAAANQDPCAPSVASTPYFAAAGVFPDTVKVLVQFQQRTTKGVIIPVGQSKTIDVQLFSTAPVGTIVVKAVDFAAAQGGTANPLLRVGQDVGAERRHAEADHHPR